jgi:hypothetical protein
MPALQMGWERVPLARWLEQQLGRWSRLGWWPRLGWWLEHLEWMPTRLDGAGWKMRTLPMGTVRKMKPPPALRLKAAPVKDR